MTVDGLEDVSSLGSVGLIEGNGTVIGNYVAEQGSGYSTNLFGVAFFPPRQSFRLQVQGTDKCGYNFTRVSDTEIKAQTIQFIKEDSSVDNVVKPGSFTNATFTLHNSGETDTFTVTYFDDQGFGVDLTVTIIDKDLESGRKARAAKTLSVTVVLKKDQSALVTATMRAPDEADIGQAATATITASSKSGSTFNYAVVQVVVAPEDPDDIPAFCLVTY